MEVEGEARQWSSVCERSTRKAGCYRTTAGSRGIQGNHGQSVPLRSDRAMTATAQGRRNPRSKQDEQAGQMRPDPARRAAIHGRDGFPDLLSCVDYFLVFTKIKVLQLEPTPPAVK